MTKLLVSVKRDVEGNKIKIYRDATPEEELRITASREKELRHLEAYTGKEESLLGKIKELSSSINELQDMIYSLEQERDYLREIDIKIRIAKGERVELMGR